ncbi:hypothetical protein TeGR_g11778 [Tetraparma gracilis]|uniref:Uncharacterized protein n=1 Tax=Tetraparma gracilis TaxID=2962635 RepID=A0ABQ6NBB8_9STRA|nr:hypothetical protein TeGR_g11778 [Tetraparma gracilis]
MSHSPPLFSLSGNALVCSCASFAATPLSGIANLSLSDAPELSSPAAVPVRPPAAAAAAAAAWYCLFLHTPLEAYAIFLTSSPTSSPSLAVHSAVPLFESLLLSSTAKALADPLTAESPERVLQLLSFPSDEAAAAAPPLPPTPTPSSPAAPSSPSPPPLPPPCVLLTTSGIYISDDLGERPVASISPDLPPPRSLALPSRTASSLLQRLTAYLLHVDGSVSAVCPLLPDSLLTPSAPLLSLRSSLAVELSSLPAPSPELPPDPHAGARNRQLRASLRFLSDAYGDRPSPPPYLAASAAGLAAGPSSTLWPTALQPSLYAPDDEAGAGPARDARVLPSPPEAPGLTVLALLREGGTVEYLVVPQQPQIRFALESDADAEVLNLSTTSTIAKIASVDFSHSAPPPAPSAPPPTFLPSPLDPSLVLVSTAPGVHAVHLPLLPALHNAFPSLLPSPPAPSPPSAYPVLTCSSSALVSSLSVSGDVRLGHVLTAALTDGTFESANLSALRYLHEAASEDEPPAPGAAKEDPMKVLRTVPPFADVARPLLGRIGEGLAATGKLVGGSTPLAEANPESVAMALACKKALERDVVEPLNELSARCENREALHKEMDKEQRKQLEKLGGLVAELRERAARSAEKGAAIGRNAEVLEERCGAALGASGELAAALTDAEVAFFKRLKGWEGQLVRWQADCREMAAAARKIADQQVQREKVTLEREESVMVDDLLRGQATILKATSEELEVVAAQLDLAAE